MATVLNVLRTCGLILYFVVNNVALLNNNKEPWIVQLEVLSKNCVSNNCKYYVIVKGDNNLRLTGERSARGSSCRVFYPNYELREVEKLEFSTKIEIIVPKENGKIYFCLRHNEVEKTSFGEGWHHQGEDIYLEPNYNGIEHVTEKLDTTVQQQQSQNLEAGEWADLSHDIDVNYLLSAKRQTRNDVETFDLVERDGNIVENRREIDEVNNKDDRQGQEIVNNVQESSEREEIVENSKENNYDDIDIECIDRKCNNIETNNKDNNLFDNKKYLVNVNNNNEITIADFQNKAKEIDDFQNNVDVQKIGNDLQTNKGLKVIDDIQNDKDIDIIEDKFQSNQDLKEIDGVKMINKDFIVKRNIKTDDVEMFQNNEGFKVIDDDLKTEAINMFEKVVKRIKRNTNADTTLNNVDNTQTNDTKRTVEPTAVEPELIIYGIRVEDSDKEPIIEDGVPSVLADSRVTLRLYGEGITYRTVVALTNYPPAEAGQPCKFILNGEYMTKPNSLTAKSALFEIIAPTTAPGSKLHLCVKNLKPNTDLTKDEAKYIYQGTDSFKIFATHNKLLPLWVTLILICLCLTFSALFSGLNLGLMSLDRTELKIISNTGTEQERKYARAIMPVRDHGNYLLCSILLGNVAVNSTFTILLDELTSGLFAVIFSTLAIVLLGEITPQAICSRHGLMVGAKSIMVTKAVMALTAPLAFPVSKLLDYFLGEEIGSVYNRERLKELVKVTTDVNDLDKDEVNIISGALELRKKSVSDVMTKMEDVFMLPITSVLDFETMSEIVKSGYSRIPVYEGSRGNIVTVLFIKDLAFVDPDDNTPLRTLCQYYQNPCNFVFEDVTLDVMFKQFKDGHKGHMAFVHRINNEGEGDPFYETTGLVTLEDVIEEMIQAEIVDETDVFMDNRTKRRRKYPQNKLQDFAAFAERHENQRIHISPQLTLATFQFLSTSVDAFRPDMVSETVLRRLLRQDVIQYIKLKGKTKKDLSTFVFQQGKPVDYFVLILEGRVEVTVGRENLVFEAGPFTYFGVQALTQNVGVAESPTPSAMGSLQNINMDSLLRHTFVPDYSVRAITELYYLTVKRSLYLAAKRATLMEKGALSKGATNEQFDTEVDKLLESVDEDISISGDHKTPSRQVSPNPLPVSASPITRASFAARASPEPRNGDMYANARADEQEKLLK